MPGDRYATAPSALERYEQDMIAYRPDMAVYAYGLNDSRCGHPLDSFLAAYETIVAKTQDALPEALVVLVGPYWNLQYDAETWSDPKYAARFGKFGRAGDDLVLAYNEAIAGLASRRSALFVDVYHVLEGAPWLLHGDACHFTDIGQRIIGLTVFCTVAASCSFLSRKSKAIEEKLNLSIGNTGGTDALPHVIETWRKADGWKQ